MWWPRSSSIAQFVSPGDKPVVVFEEVVGFAEETQLVCVL